MKVHLTATGRHILKRLLEHNYYLTTTEVADTSGVSWNTAWKYLNRFYRYGWVNKRHRGNRIYWRACR